MSSLLWLDILPKYDAHAVDVANRQLTDAIRLVRRTACNFRSSIRDLSMISIDVTEPLK